MQVCTLLQTDNHANTPPLVFLQAGCPSCRPTNSVKTLKDICGILWYIELGNLLTRLVYTRVPTGPAKSENSWQMKIKFLACKSHEIGCWSWKSPGARFTKYLMTILRLSYDNAKVTIDLRRTSNLQKRLTKNSRLFWGTIHLQSCTIVWDSVCKLAYDIHKRNFSTFKVTIVSRSYDKLTIILR